MEEFDLVVIGGGSGGVRTARWSANLGAKVGICEEDRYGGTCVIRGCIPKKLMVYASALHYIKKGPKCSKIGQARPKMVENRSKRVQNGRK